MKITSYTSGAYYVQHFACLVAQRDTSGINFDKVEIAFILALNCWLKPLTDEAGEETGVR